MERERYRITSTGTTTLDWVISQIRSFYRAKRPCQVCEMVLERDSEILERWLTNNTYIPFKNFFDKDYSNIHIRGEEDGISEGTCLETGNYFHLFKKEGKEPEFWIIIKC